jgi:uncharacterized protein (DUF427 family)
VGGQTVVDTTEAWYVWEWPYYPQYFIPVDDVRADVLVPLGIIQHSPRGDLEVADLRVGDITRHHAARLLANSRFAELHRTVRFDWSGFDSWFEEDEQVFVHPRSPYVRVDALRSTRTVRVEMEGEVLAESTSPVMVFETGLPTRYYLNRTDISWSHLLPSDTVTECPYKGTTSGYWSVRRGGSIETDLAWSYDFPTRQLLPIAGMVAFYNEKVDLFVDGGQLERPVTHFVRSDPGGRP